MKPRKILFFSRSVLFEHPVVCRQGQELSFAEKAFVDMARPVGLEVCCTKDGRVFDDSLDDFAAICSYTCGAAEDMIKQEAKDGSPPMSPQGLARLREAVAGGKPFVAIHPGFWILPEAVGCGYIGHGAQQNGTMQVVSPQFPGVQGCGQSFTMMEEWFSLCDFASDLHVVLVQDTRSMNKEQPTDKKCYDRPSFPATWARLHGKGRVFFTSMGHREDVWTSDIFQHVLLGGLSWALGDVDADVTPNIRVVAPDATVQD